MAADSLSTLPELPETPTAPEPTATPRVPGHERIMLVILGLTVAAVCLLISAPERHEDGQVAWKSGSLLRVVTDLMTLFHQYPTTRGVEIKWLAQSVGAAAAIVAAAVMWFARGSRRSDSLVLAAPLPVADRALTLPTAAQLAMIAFGAWTMLSFLWAPWPDAAFGEAIRLAMGIGWAIAIGRSLSPRAARRGAEILFGILTISALLGIWYYFERNPAQRLKFPIGNPIFLAACLLPGFCIAFAMIAAALSPAENQAAADRSGRSRLIRGAVAAVALVPLAIAFTKADSRGPGIGLILGILVAVFLLLPRFWRVLYVGGLTCGVALIAILRLWPVSWFLSRPDTLRFRLHAWRYAWELFLSRPLGGKGQGSYLLLAQGLSRPDAIRDPIAFPGALLGHAHNEWLEVLADLGAIGLAFVAIALGMTLWAGVVALRRQYRGARRRPKSADGWYLLGLLAALVAMMIEVASDVSLRMPGLPVIFYTVLGLIWAFSNPAPPAPAATDWDQVEPEPTTRSRLLKPARVTVLLASFGIAWLVGSAGVHDWLGSLAVPVLLDHTSKGHYEEAMEATLVTTGGSPGISPRLTQGGLTRLGVESRVEANYQAVYIARQAAGQKFQQLREMLLDAQRSRRDLNRLREIAQEDAANFAVYFNLCTGIGNGLISVIPGYPEVAGLVGDAWILRRDMELLLNSIGGPDVPGDGAEYLATAHNYLLAEFQYDPLDAENGLRLLQVAQGDPLPVRINCLRLPLRRSGISGGTEAALTRLMQDPQFAATMNEMLSQAEAALDASESAWPDPYAPETLRLAAIASKTRGEFAQAATLAGEGATLSAYLLDRFPALFGQAKREQAQYLFLANPDLVQPAIEVMKDGLKSWPAKANAEQHGQALREWSLYCLASDDLDTAREIIQHLVDRPMTRESLDYNLGCGFGELCQMFLPLKPDRRPTHFDHWLQQALELAPTWMPARIVAVRVALEKNDAAAARQQLLSLRETAADPRQLAAVTQSLMAAFPNSPVLQEFAARIGASASQVAEDGIAPDSQPETTTAPAGS